MCGACSCRLQGVQLAEYIRLVLCSQIILVCLGYTGNSLVRSLTFGGSGGMASRIKTRSGLELLPAKQGRTQKGGKGPRDSDIMIRRLTPCLMHHGHGNVALILCAVMEATSAGYGDMCISAPL